MQQKVVESDSENDYNDSFLIETKKLLVDFDEPCSAMWPMWNNNELKYHIYRCMYRVTTPAATLVVQIKLFQLYFKVRWSWCRALVIDAKAAWCGIVKKNCIQDAGVLSMEWEVPAKLVDCS